MDYWLAGCGIDTTDEVIFTFETLEGEKDYLYQFVPYNQINGIPESSDESEQDNQKSVKYEIDQENNTALFTLTACTYDEEYRNTVDRFFSEVHDSGIQNIIVDLRGNGGGSSTVADYFLSHMAVGQIKGWDFKREMHKLR